MKLIQCIVRPEKVNDVVEKLTAVIPGLTVCDVQGHGRQKGRPAVYRGIEYQLTLLPKAMIEIVTDDDRVDELVKVITESARTGEIGDGRIFILPVEASYHVRTGFMG